MKKLIKQLLGLPAFIIRDGYMERWHLIPANKYFNIYLHHVNFTDPGKDQHDHPWWSVSFLLKGDGLHNQTPIGIKPVKWMFPVIRTPTHIHRLIIKGSPVWTLFITGPHVRDWGFYTNKGWVYWKDYLGIKYDKQK